MQNPLSKGTSGNPPPHHFLLISKAPTGEHHQNTTAPFASPSANGIYMAITAHERMSPLFGYLTWPGMTHRTFRRGDMEAPHPLIVKFHKSEMSC